MAAPLAVLAGDTLPHAVAEQDTVQVTPLFVESPSTVAINGADAPPRTVATGGATETATEGTVMVAEEDLLLSVTDVAVTVTLRLLAGGKLGAV